MKKEILFVLGLLLFIPCYGQLSVDILVVGAGGSGGAHQSVGTAGTGGGGGGGVVYVQNTLISNGTYTVTVAPTTNGKQMGNKMERLERLDVVVLETMEEIVR